MNKNTAAALATAFATYAELAAACAKGYRPSLRAAKTDELPIRRAKMVLESALTAAGYAVYA